MKWYKARRPYLDEVTGIVEEELDADEAAGDHDSDDNCACQPGD